MYLGSGAHGVEAAARLYFGKPAIDLELAEAALIAGIFQTPSRQSPLINPDLARARRDYVLGEMAENDFITAAEAEAAIASDIVLAERTPRRPSIAPYFVEEVRQHLEATYGAGPLFEDGLEVHTTLDARLQAAANAAVEAVRALVNPTPAGETFSSAVVSDGNPYGMPDGLIFSFPCRSAGDGSYEIIGGQTHDDFLKGKIEATAAELVEEREVIQDLLR